MPAPFGRSVLRRREAEQKYGVRVVRRELAARRWVLIGRVVVTHNGPLSWQEKVALGIAALPDGRAAVDAESALHLTHRLDQPPVPQVAVLGGSRPPALSGVAYTWIGDLRDKVIKADRMPTLLPAHAALRAAARYTTEREARALLCRVLQRGATSADQLGVTLGPHPRLRYAAVAAEVIADFRGGIQSVPEREFDDIRRRHHLPAPARQRRVRGRDGRYYLDAAYDEFGLGVEVHGWQHWEFSHREADNWRSAEIVARGRRLLVFSSWAVRREPERVADLLRLSLRTGGWRG